MISLPFLSCLKERRKDLNRRRSRRRSSGPDPEEFYLLQDTEKFSGGPSSDQTLQNLQHLTKKGFLLLEEVQSDLIRSFMEEAVNIDGEEEEGGDSSSSSSSCYSTAEEDSFENGRLDLNKLERNIAVVSPLMRRSPSSAQRSMRTNSDEEEGDNNEDRRGRRDNKWVDNPMLIITQGLQLNAEHLQMLLNCFKKEEISPKHCEMILEFLQISQSQNDFQWALHQIGGFNVLLFLFARVVEITPDPKVQINGLSLCLNHLRNHGQYTPEESDPSKVYQLLRFVLNSDKSVWSYELYSLLMSYSVSSSGNKLVDYPLLKICLLSSWRRLLLTTHVCKKEDSDQEVPEEPLPITLFQILLEKILQLTVETNPHRGKNISTLKKSHFISLLLSICYNIIHEFPCDSTLSESDAKNLCEILKSILDEFMAPPDVSVCIDLVKFGLCPFLPHDLPPIPRVEDAYFVFQKYKPVRTPLSSLTTPRFLEEAAEMRESDASESMYLRLGDTDNEDDIPELLGVQWKNRRNSHPITSQSGFDQRGRNISGRKRSEFKRIFSENLVSSLMSVLLKAIPMLPDASFASLLNSGLTPHLFVSYCSHHSSPIKRISLKLLSAYLARLDCKEISAFVQNRGFFLTSHYLQTSPDLLPELVINICRGYGPVSYPLLISMLQSPLVVSSLLDWIKEDESGTIPSLLSLGLLPALCNLNHRVLSCELGPLLHNLTSSIASFCSTTPKDDIWRISYTPGLESSASSSPLFTARLLKSSLESLRHCDWSLKKSTLHERLLWLIERVVSLELGVEFDAWFASMYVQLILEENIMGESELWRSFVKKNRKRLNYLFGIFLCKIFEPNYGDLEVKHEYLRVFTGSPSIAGWLPRVLRSEEGIERVFTAFFRIFMKASRNDQRNRGAAEGQRRSIQFHDIMSNIGPMDEDLSLLRQLPKPNSVLRENFESILVNSGILITPFQHSFYSDAPGFGKPKAFGLEPHLVSSVSFQEIRLCQSLLEKMQGQFIGPKEKGYSEIESNFMAKFQTKLNPLNGIYFTNLFESLVKYSLETLDVITRLRTQQEIQMVRIMSVRGEDVDAKGHWWKIVEQLTHPKAPWHFPQSYPESLSLSQSEGPGRIRIRMKRERIRISSDFIMSKFRKPDLGPEPLTYLFAHEDSLALPLIHSNVVFMRLCTRIIPGEEISGELVLSEDSLYFIPESSNFRQEQIEINKGRILHILKRRYSLEERAVEIFIECRSYFLVFPKTKDRDEFLTHFSGKNSNPKIFIGTGTNIGNSTLLDSSLISMTSQWTAGNLSNYDYLMFLNTMAGRTFCDLMQYPVYPFVLAKYDTPTLDLLTPQSYRNLRRPMAIQDPAKEKHFITNYNYLRLEEFESKPFHYGSHYSNSGIVLHFLVRLPPYTQHFLRYQDGAFDIPDRSFHSIETTWRLASRESNTDFKESIPEFYYLPEIFKNLQKFDFGIRQNGERVDDVNLPQWSKGDPRIFTLVNRQALESNQVRAHLHHWIDLIFGFKQTGKAAEEAINVFHPSTYEGFEVEGNGDELMTQARKAMVSTYGQTPKQLFTRSHLKSIINPSESYEREVLDTVCGIRWGNFVGSPASSSTVILTTREYENPMKLFETSTRIVFWPEKTLILSDNVVGTWDASGIRIKSNVIYLSVGDEITFCRGTDIPCLWVGHQSGRISVLKLSRDYERVLETVYLVGHHQPIKYIDINQEFSTAISCSSEDFVLLWDLIDMSYANTIELEGPIDEVYSSRTTGDVIMLNRTQNQATLATINGFIVGTIQPEERIESVCLSGLDPGRNVNVVALGCDYGLIRLYSTWDLRFITQIKVFPLFTLPIKSIRYIKDGQRLYCMSMSDKRSISVTLSL